MANKNKTPLLRPLRTDGGTMYIFPSASEDIGLNLNSRATGVALSHYALLNFPLNFNTCSNSTDYNKRLAEDLLNYVMNFETILLNQDSYNYQEYQTVSERVFWHWLKDRTQNISFTECSDATTALGNDIYKENATQNNRIVQCFGSIDAGNSLSTEFGMFNETYINIPTSYGNGPVFFRKTLNSDRSNLITKLSYLSTESGCLEGRTADTPLILSSNAPIYETDENHYYSEEYYEIVKEIPILLEILSEETKKDNIIITSFDDINIDSAKNFEGQTYDITTNLCSFDFNAILLYYSIYDLDNPTKESLAVNLFGIIFLDGVKPSGSNYFILPLTKKKTYSAESSNYFGNSYSFRVNLKTMSIYDKSDAKIEDNTTLASINSVDFSEVISNLNKAIDTMNTNVLVTRLIQENYIKILAYYDDQKEHVQDLSTLVNAYVRGEHIGIINTDTLYANNVKSNNDNIDILLYAYEDANNVIHYSDPLKIYKHGLTTNPGVAYPIDLFETLTIDENAQEVSSLTITGILNSVVINFKTVNDVKNSLVYEIDTTQLPNALQHLTITDSDNKTYIDYCRLVPYLLKEILTLNLKIDELS